MVAGTGGDADEKRSQLSVTGVEVFALPPTEAFDRMTSKTLGEPGKDQLLGQDISA